MLEVRKRGNRNSFVLDDRTGRIEVALHEEVFTQYRDLIVKDARVLVEGNLRFDEFSDAWRISGKRILLLDAVRESQARRLVLRWPISTTMPGEALAARLAEVLAPFRPGDCEVLVRYQGAGARCLLSLGTGWAVRPAAELLENLESLVGHDALQLLYDVPTAPGLRAGGPGP